MCNQLWVQFIKFRCFWWFYIAAFCLAVCGFIYGNKLAGLGFHVYNALDSTLGDSSFMFLLALVSAWFTGSDFSNRTIHHEIVSGYTRRSVLMVREVPAYLSAVSLHVIYVVFTVLGTWIVTGFSTVEFGVRDALWAAVIVLQLIALQSIVIFISFACAKASAAIAVSVCFVFFTCNILRNFLHGAIFMSSVFCLAQDNTYETLFPAGIVAAFTWFVTIALTYLVFRKKEIK